MQLRAWQNEAIYSALNKFQRPFTHFLCLATPGAGKTIMAAELSRRLLESGAIDLVVCFSPSSIIAKDFRMSLESITRKSFCGGMGAAGQSLTYQSMTHLGQSFWALFDHFRIFVIFDEIHHCAGHDMQNANSWGLHILKFIQEKAIYSLALTGTPWRSDTIPISLSNYSSGNRIQVDYEYSLKRAIDENVCRAPSICAVNNELIRVINERETKEYNSFEELLAQSACKYSDLIHNKSIIEYMLTLVKEQLYSERLNFSDAGGLIVASSTSHAKSIQQVLANMGEKSVLVSYQEPNSTETISQFKISSEKWIISIGMISEGTNIPRLRVCCYLSLITTELYFRQVLGRVLRVVSNQKETGYLFMLSHPSLLTYAQRVSKEIPHLAVFKSEKFNKPYGSIRDANDSPTLNSCNPNEEMEIQSINSKQIESSSSLQNQLDNWYATSIGSFGRFFKQIYQL